MGGPNNTNRKGGATGTGSSKTFCAGKGGNGGAGGTGGAAGAACTAIAAFAGAECLRRANSRCAAFSAHTTQTAHTTISTEGAQTARAAANRIGVHPWHRSRLRVKVYEYAERAAAAANGGNNSFSVFIYFNAQPGSVP